MELRMSNVEQLVLQAKACFQAKDYEACMSLTAEALRADPGNTEASWLMKEAQRQWEDQRSLEQLEIYAENLKKEAIDLFDKEHYEQCLGMFRFLSELEPENHTLRDYVRLSQQMFVETIGSGKAATSHAHTTRAAAEEKRDERRPDSEEDETGNYRELPAAVEPQVEVSRSIIGLPGATQRARESLESDAIPESVKQKIVEDYPARTARARPVRSRSIWLLAALSFVSAFSLGCLWFYLRSAKSRLEIQSVPEKAIVFLDNQKVGETPVRRDGITAGDHSLRIEKQGYQPQDRRLWFEPGQAVTVLAQLEKAKVQSPVSLQPPVPVQPAVPPVSQAQTQALQPKRQDPVEPEKADVRMAQSVIHDHLLGSCSGRLKIEGDRISFWSSGNAHEAFTRKISQVTNVQLSDKLLIEFGDNAYRFEALARDAGGTRQQLGPLYRQIQLQKRTHRRPL